MMSKLLLSHEHSLLPISLLMALSFLQAATAGKSSDGYFYGRDTFYEDNQQGSCHYYNDIPDYYAAWTCWEIQCQDEGFSDGYGQYMDRKSVCKDTSKRVVVKIVDSCPCEHANWYSNRHWCCGDMNHIYLGRKAFLELADEHCDVIGLKWKQASCDKLGVQDSGSWSTASSSASSSSGDSSSGSSSWSLSSDHNSDQKGFWNDHGQWVDFTKRTSSNQKGYWNDCGQWIDFKPWKCFVSTTD